MSITKEAVLYGIIGLLAGSLISIVVATTAVNNHNGNLMKMMGMHTDGKGNTMMNTDNSNMNMEGM